VLHRAKLLSELQVAVPAFLVERVAKGDPLPCIEVVELQEVEGGASGAGRRSASGVEDPEGRERDAMLSHVMGQLNSHLYTELIQGMGLHMAIKTTRARRTP
jgi:hypothetical protein